MVALRLGPSAHVDTFSRDSLPPADEWPEMIFELPELHYPPVLNCAVSLLDDTIARYGADRPCLLAPDGPCWTYGEVRALANQIAHVLVTRHGIVPGNRVLLRGPNNPWLAACWLGVATAGAVAVATMPLLRAHELTTIAAIASARLALCDHRYLSDLAAAEIADLQVVPFGGTSAADLSNLVAGAPTSFEPVATSADDVVMLAFTSGTTGRPKATMHFHRDIVAITDTFSAHVLRPVPEDVFIGTPPLAFTFGLGGLLAFPLRAGSATLLIEKATPNELADLIVAHGATVCFTAPTAYRAMLAAGRAPALGGLRRAVSAGEHLSAATWQAVHDATGVSIIDGIGSTELLHIFIAAADADIRPGSTGRVVPGYRAAVVDSHGTPVPFGTPGRLAVKGPTGCRYLDDDRQRVYVQDGWNITGDTFTCDAEGYFYYEARSDDMIVSSGYNIAGPEVEEALMAHEDVVECGVVGVADEARGQIVKAFVVLRDGVAPSADQVVRLQDFVKATVAPYKYPRAISFVDSLPRTASGKLQRYRLRELR